MKKKKVLGLCLLLSGILLFSFPFVSMISRDFKQLGAQKSYAEYLTENRETLQETRQKLEEENLSTQPVQDIFTQDKETAINQNSPYLAILDTSQVVGQVSIPALGQNFDLYLDADYNKIAKGVAVMVGTGAPVGIKGQRPIIAGHRITYNDMSFYFLPDLVKGDKIYVTFLDQTLEYQVYQTDIIDEYDNEKLAPIPDKDVITLMTCYNAPEYNQRYLVNAIRVEKETSEEQGATKSSATITRLLTQKDSKTSVKLLRLAPYAVLLIALASFLYFARKLWKLIQK
jgi:sortase A